MGYVLTGTIAGLAYIRYAKSFIEGSDTDKLVLFTVLWPVFLIVAILIMPAFVAMTLSKRIGRTNWQ
jgi:hypothetical protein